MNLCEKFIRQISVIIFDGKKDNRNMGWHSHRKYIGIDVFLFNLSRSHFIHATRKMQASCRVFVVMLRTLWITTAYFAKVTC